MLTRLVERGGTALLYTHLGKITRPDEPFRPPTQKALRNLAEHAYAGKILVTTTRRLLGYCRTLTLVDVSTRLEGDVVHVDLTGRPQEPHPRLDEELEGLTLYVSDPRRTRVTVGGEPIPHLQHNGPDHTGRPSVSIPWTRLRFPEP
jgi:hypothetical protein